MTDALRSALTQLVEEIRKESRSVEANGGWGNQRACNLATFVRERADKLSVLLSAHPEQEVLKENSDS